MLRKVLTAFLFVALAMSVLHTNGASAPADARMAAAPLHDCDCPPGGGDCNPGQTKGCPASTNCMAPYGPLQVMFHEPAGVPCRLLCPQPQSLGRFTLPPSNAGALPFRPPKSPILV